MTDSHVSLPRTLARVLAPSWHALLAVAVTLAWRVAMLSARGLLEADAIRAMDMTQMRMLAKGAVWDVLLVLGAVLLLRAAALLAVRLGATLAIPVFLATLLAVVTTVLRAADLGHCYLGRSHFSAESFLYIQGGYNDRILSTRGLALVAAVLLALTTLAWSLRRDMRNTVVLTSVAQHRLQGPSRTLLWLVPALVGLLLAGRVGLDAWRYPPHEFELRVVPELNFARQLRVFSQDAADRATLQVPVVPAATWQRWQAAGLVPRGLAPDRPYPLFRQGLGEPPLGYPTQPGAPAQPDVVLTLMESVNRVFVDELSGTFKGLMPNLGRFIHGTGAARRMTAVEGYWNTTSPTIAGTVASLCSLYSPVHPGDLNGRSPVFGNAHYLCMAEVLRQAGYRTAFIQGADLVGANMDKFLVAHGFDEVLADAALSHRFPNAAKTEMGYHDADVLTFAKEHILHLESLKKRDGRPFFVVIATLDTHEPGLATDDCHLPRGPDGQLTVAGVPNEPSGQKVLTAFHCTDKALGDLGDFLLAPGRGERLLWAITSDHASFRTLANDSVFKGLGTGWSFDRLPLLIHDPLHALPAKVEVLSGSLDVAPTLLHLLGHEAAATNMMGHSVFGSRPQLPFLAGRIGARRAFVKVQSTEHEMPMAELGALCQRHEPLLAVPTPVDACELVLWFDWQDALWALRRLAPPAGRVGF